MEITIACYRRRLKDDEPTSSRNKNSLGGSEEKECLYSESDTPEMLDKFPKKGLIELLESKCHEKNRRTNDPKYCRYHTIISHPIEKCRAFKEQIMQLEK